MVKAGAPADNENAISHGVYSYQRSGEVPEARRTPAVMTRIQEIQENLATAEGLEREQEQVTEKSLAALDLALGWVQQKRRDGRALDDIKVFKMLPALLNTAGRQLAQLLEMKERVGKTGMLADYEQILKQGQDG